MTPIPVSAFLAMIQAGYPVDYMFRICVQTINGIDNRFGGERMGRTAHPDFYRLIDAMRRIQKKGTLGMRVKQLEKRKTQFEEVMAVVTTRDSFDLDEIKSLCQEARSQFATPHFINNVLNFIIIMLDR